MRLILGDCLEKIKELEDNSVDAVVTDPPYELGFMGKKWDNTGIAYNVELWKEVFRVLKSGGYLLSFGGTRTYHRMAVAIEDAGFEIRDMVEWVYGSGFPKSLNIGKAVDKLQGNERKYIGNKAEMNGRNPNNHKSINGVNTTFQSGWDKETTKGTSEWEGWGTALKPAHEPICMARKPLSEKTVAENCLKWGVGGINIDGCRVATNELTPRNNNNTETLLKKGFEGEAKTIEPSPLGRFPANLIHDGSKEVVGLFPSAKGGAYPKERGKSGIGFGSGRFSGDSPAHSMGDSGSASRFFYCAKASKSERNMGCEGLEEKKGGGMKGTEDQTLLTGSGNTRNNLNRNNHPTVKPLSLMRYLCKMVTPPEGIVLDPFMGSGSTGIAAKLEGFDFIGIEKESEYMDIAQARIDMWKKDSQISLLGK